MRGIANTHVAQRHAPEDRRTGPGSRWLNAFVYEDVYEDFFSLLAARNPAAAVSFSHIYTPRFVFP